MLGLNSSKLDAFERTVACPRRPNSRTVQLAVMVERYSVTTDTRVEADNEAQSYLDAKGRRRARNHRTGDILGRRFEQFYVGLVYEMIMSQESN